MILQSIVSYFHYLSIFVLVGAVVIEYYVFNAKLTASQVLTLSRADMFYGISSVLILTTGLLRVLYFGKGETYYMSNHIFWTKIGLFTLVGILSIYPTVKFAAWKKQLKKSDDWTFPRQNYQTIRNIILIELILIAFIPLCAAFMARGIG